jgi:Ca2+-binding RTX toxin-like protein
MDRVEVGNLLSIHSFQYSSEVGYTLPVRTLYPVDLDGDGVEELILAGVETQPNTPDKFKGTDITIFGWKNGIFQNITSNWLPNGINRLEGAGAIAFGDFNGDGLIDFYTGGNADMDYAINAYQFINQGNYFERTNLGLSMWEHGYAVADINGDGYDDVIPLGWSQLASPLMGSQFGLTRLNGDSMPGSGGVIADFLGNGDPYLIVVDQGGGIQDTRLFSILFDSIHHRLYYELVSELPMPILESYDFIVDDYDKSHDVRVVALDFNYDNLIDAIVFSRGGWDGQVWVKKSAVQFLKNDGDGKFTDVTNEFLRNYYIDSYVGYNPIISDFNLDGRLDIFHSDSSWEGVNKSTSIILGNQDGTFEDQNRSIFSDLLSPNGGISSIIKGPNEKYYFVTDNVYGGGKAELKVYYLTFPSREAAEILMGTPGNDKIYGFGGDDIIYASAGNDFIEGGDGIDTLVVSALPSQYQWNGSTLSGIDGIDTLKSIEYIRFGEFLGNDQLVTNLMPSQLVDPDGNGPRVSQAKELLQGISDLYIAYFNRSPDLEGLMYWFKELNNGSWTLSQVSSSFTDQPEYRAAYPAGSSNREFIEQIYQNLFDRAPDAEGWDYWENDLNNGSPRDVFILTVINGAYAPTGGADDKALLNNKNAVSLYYTEQLALFPTKDFDANISEVLNLVTKNPATVDQGLINDAQAFNAFWGA